MANTTPLLHNPWKVKYTLTPKPTAMLVSWYDLLMYEDENDPDPVTGKPKNKLRYDIPDKDTPNVKYNGLSLPHDIIAYSNKLYDDETGAAVMGSDTSEFKDLFLQYGIDLGKPSYDKRSIPLMNSPTVLYPELSAITCFKPNSIYVEYDKDAALYPQTSEEIINSTLVPPAGPSDSLTYQHIWSKDRKIIGAHPWFLYGGAEYAYWPFSVSYITSNTGGIATTNLSNGGEIPQTFIVLGDHDSIFETAIVEKTLQPFTTMCLNIFSEWKIDGDRIAPMSPTGSNPDYSPILNILIDLFNLQGESNEYAYILSTFGDNTTIDPWKIRKLITEVFAEPLKRQYVWVRASFFGDYVSPSSFEQELNSKSDVVHKNLVISGQGDFNRYDNSSVVTPPPKSVEQYKSENTRPYIPQTIPSIDLLSKVLVPAYSNDDIKLNELIQEVYKTIDENKDLIGNVLTEPVGRAVPDSTTLQTNLSQLSPDGYFDSESYINFQKVDDKINWGSGGDYLRKKLKPVLLPKNGNAVIDGRIFSPTIDELWHYIKRLVDGRPEDNAITEHDSFKLTSNTKNDKNTQLPTSANFEFKYNDTTEDKIIPKFGDPLSYIIVTSPENTASGELVNNEELIVDFFINSPDKIDYGIFDALIKISNKIINVSSITDPLNNRLIQNFKAEDQYINSSNKIEYDNTKEAGTESSSLWRPRQRPYSLRELEAENKLIKFNLITFMKYIKANFAVTGNILKKIDGAGGLAQFHKDYNYDIESPNTLYNEGYSSELVGKPIFNDLLLPIGNDSETNDIKHLTHETYGTDPKLKDTSKSYNADDVYLSAAGNWKYKFDKIRIPVLDSDY